MAQRNIKQLANKCYGYELILDLHRCDSSTFNRDSIEGFFTELCELIEMEKCEVHFWDDVGVPIDEQQTDSQTKGTSAVCFILTSTIVIHTLELLETVYVNIFSCKTFNPRVATEFAISWFNGEIESSNFLERL